MQERCCCLRAGAQGQSWSELPWWHGEPEQQLRRLLALAGAELCQCRRQLRLEERDGLALGGVAGQPAQRGTLVLDRIFLGVEEQESERLLQRQVADLAGARFGDEQVAADRSREDRPRMPLALCACAIRALDGASAE